MALTPKGRSTRARIIAGAAEVLRENDFEPLTLDDLRAATSTSKSQLSRARTLMRDLLTGSESRGGHDAR